MIDYKITDFNIDELGSFYTKDKTVFRVFAPEHNTLFLIINNEKHQMKKDHYTFEIELEGDYHLSRYHFISENNISFNDPFAYLAKDGESIVMDQERFIKEKITPKAFEDIVIYETSVRDFSSDDSFPSDNKKKFLALAESGIKIDDYYVLGLDYLKNIGITHLQLMPIFAFDNDKTEYNWGYNPVAFNYVSESYVSDIDDPYAYINEFRYVVNRLHENDIRVVLDVVFNHVYDVMTFDIEKMIPGHFLRRKVDGSLAAGTFCGSEIKSEDVFVRAYILKMVKRYIELFDIDGLRMDLMGISDIETVNQIHGVSTAIKNDFVVYGEGWNMGDALPEELRASISNVSKLHDVGMFNDMFRETIIDYVSGNIHNGNIEKAIAAKSDYLDCYHSLNYVECHDGPTLFDRFINDHNDEFTQRKCRLALALVMFSRGIPFIHSGQEFMRTKKGVANSYNCPDDINSLDWNQRIFHNDMCDYLKDLIIFRKENDVFRKYDVKISFYRYHESLIYCLDDLIIFINPGDNDVVFNDGNKHRILMNIYGKCDYFMEQIEVPAHSLMIWKNVMV